MRPRSQRICKCSENIWPKQHEATEIQPKIANAPASDAAGFFQLQVEVALYIESISAELRQMAKTANLEALSYFLEMTRIEASIQVERHALSMPDH